MGKNQIITKKLREKCHRMAGYCRSKTKQSLFGKVYFGEAFYQMVKKFDCYKFLKDGTTKVGPRIPDFFALWIAATFLISTEPLCRI